MLIAPKTFITLASAVACALLTNCSAPTSDPTQLSEADCTLGNLDYEEAKELRKLPLTRCETDSDCVLIPGICSAPVPAHKDDAECLIRLNALSGAVVDCAPRDDSGVPAPICFDNRCQSGDSLR